MIPRLPVMTSFLLASSSFAASPRLEAARRAAALERLEAQGLQGAARDAGAKAEAAWRLSRAEAWEKALGKAASAATPQDSDAIVASSARGAGHERDGRPGPLPLGLILREGDKISAGGAPAEVRFHDGTSLTLSVDAVVVFLQVPRADPPQALVSLEKGVVHYESAAMTRGILRVRAGRTEVVLKEGACDVSAHPEGASVRPYRGRIEAVASGRGLAPGWWAAAFGK